MRMPPSAVSRPKAGVSKPSKPAAAGASHLRPPSTSSSSSVGGWGSGFTMAEPEPQEEQCPAATPTASPAVTPAKTADSRAVKALLEDPSDARPAPPPAPAAAVAGLPRDARVTLEQLAGRLGAAAQSTSASLTGASWEEAFLAGLAVGLALPASGRRRSARERALLAVVLAGVLMVLGGSALLLAGTAQTSPSVYYQ